MAEPSERPKRSKPPKGWQKVFLKWLEETGVYGYSARKAHVGISTVQRLRNRDPKFEAACDNAIELAADDLEVEGRRRAKDGVLKPVYQGGTEVGSIREYSDTLLMFLLKGARPEKFRDNYNLQAAIEQLRAAALSASASNPQGSNGSTSEP